MTPEGIVKKECADFLDLVPGLDCWYSPANKPSAGRKRTSKHEKPTLDIVGRWGPYFFTVEIKAPGALTKPDRLKMQMTIVSQTLASGGFAAITDSVHDLREKMRIWGRQKGLIVP